LTPDASGRTAKSKIKNVYGVHPMKLMVSAVTLQFLTISAVQLAFSDRREVREASRVM
jgi:hypothetical protein